MKQQREFLATLEAITPFYKKRLINQQVKAGLLVAPLKSSPHDMKGNKVWDSDDEQTSSDEDFDYLR